MSDYAELEKLVDAYGRDEWHHGNTPDFTNKRELALSHKAELMMAINRLVADRDALRKDVERYQWMLNNCYADADREQEQKL